MTEIALVDAFEVGDRIESVGDAGDTLGFQNPGDLVETLVDTPALIQRCACRICRDASNLDSIEVASDVTHFGIDLVVGGAQRPFRRTPGHDSTRAVIDRASRSVGTVLGK